MMNILAQCYYSLEKSCCTKITFSIFVQIFSLYLLFEKKLIDHFTPSSDRTVKWKTLITSKPQRKKIMKFLVNIGNM